MNIKTHCILIKGRKFSRKQQICFMDVYTDDIESVFIKIAKSNDLNIKKYKIRRKGTDRISCNEDLSTQVLIITIEKSDIDKFIVVLEKLHRDALLMGCNNFTEYSESYVTDFKKFHDNNMKE